MDRSGCEGLRGMDRSRDQMVSVCLDQGRGPSECQARNCWLVFSCTNYVTRRGTAIYQFRARFPEEASGVRCTGYVSGRQQNGQQMEAGRMDGAGGLWKKSGNVTETMSFRLLRIGKAAGGNLGWKMVGVVVGKVCICLDEELPVQNIQNDKVVESWHNRPDQVLRQRHQMVPAVAGNIDAVSERTRRRRDCVWMAEVRKDQETMGAEIGRSEAGCRGDGGLPSTLFLKTV